MVVKEPETEVIAQWNGPETDSRVTMHMSPGPAGHSESSTPGGFASAFWEGASAYAYGSEHDDILSPRGMDELLHSSLRHSIVKAPKASDQDDYFSE